MKRLVIALVLVLIVLHQDFWWWDRIDPVVFGFLPIGLASHVVLSLLTAAVWAVAVRVWWPVKIDPEAQGGVRRSGPEL